MFRQLQPCKVKIERVEQTLRPRIWDSRVKTSPTCLPFKASKIKD